MHSCTTTWGLLRTEKPKKLKIELDKLGSTHSRSLKRQHPLTAETLEKIDSKLPCFDPKVKRLETLQYLTKEQEDKNVNESRARISCLEQMVVLGILSIPDEETECRDLNSATMTQLNIFRALLRAVHYSKQQLPRIFYLKGAVITKKF